MTTYCSFFLVTALICFSLAHIALIGKSNYSINRITALLIVSISGWAFIEFIAHSSHNEAIATFWFSFIAFRVLILAFFIHIVILLLSWLNQSVKKFILYSTYSIIIILGLLVYINSDIVLAKNSCGWTFLIERSFIVVLTEITTAVFIALSTILLSVHLLKEQSVRSKKQTLSIIGGSIFLFGGALLVKLVRSESPETIPVIMLFCDSIGVILILLAIMRFKPFELSPREAAGVIVKTMSDALVVVNMDRKIEIVNSALVRMLGYSEHELLGKRPEIIIGRFESNDDSITRLLRSGVVSDVRTFLRKKNGDSIPISLSWSVLRDVDQKIVGIVFIGRDMSEREKAQDQLQHASNELEKRIETRTQELKIANEQLKIKIQEREKAENQLSAEKEWLSVTLRSIGDGVITTDSLGMITSLNPAAEHLTGWSYPDACGKNIDQVFHYVQHEDDMENKTESSLSQMIKGGSNKPVNSQSLLLSKDGVRFTVTEQVTPIIDNTGCRIGFVMVVRDVTERTLLEREVFRVKKLESINLLAGGIAHDFNNLLTSIVTNLFMAKMELTSNGEVTQLITNAEKAAFRASNLTKQLLLFSRSAVFCKEKLAIREVIENSVGFYLSDSKSDYRLEFEAELLDIMIDRSQIDQVLSNIITNADEAMMHGGTIAVKVKNIEINHTHNLPIKNGKYVQITISDEGLGIDEFIINKIFDPYFTTRKNSNGLGLTTAFAIVQKHGGHITVQSEKKQGTTFSIYLPAADEALTEESRSISEVQANSCKNILLMDDEEIVRKSTQKVLVHLGYDVTLAENGDQALAILKEFKDRNIKFFAVILDLTIHGGKGAREIVSDILTLDEATKIIISSGYANDATMINYQELGFHAAIFKPYEIDILTNILNNLSDPQNN